MTTETRRTGKKARRQAEEQARRRQQELARQRKRTALILGGILGVALLIALIGFLAMQSTTSGEELGQAMPDQGRTHIAPGESHPPYNSTPPTSGWHLVNPAPWGVHQDPIPDEVQVHNLEHGGVLIQYNCASEGPDGQLDQPQCKQLADSIGAIVRRYPSKVLSAPYPDMPSRIAVTAWDRIMTLDQVDETKIRRFVDRYRGQGPEFVPE